MTCSKTKAFFTLLATAALTGVVTIGTMMFAQQVRARAHPFSSKHSLSAQEEQRYSDSIGMTPETAATNFFGACGREDWDEVAKYMPPELLKRDANFMERFKAGYGGMQIVSVGKPFKAGLTKINGQMYPGVFVPYEIRLKDGSIKKWQMAIRCDNPDKRWYWDGGM